MLLAMTSYVIHAGSVAISKRGGKNQTQTKKGKEKRKRGRI